MTQRTLPLYGSRPRPCPYLAGRTERSVAAELSGPDVDGLYEGAVRAGFRRSYGYVYRPACPGCDACRPIRVLAAEFAARRSLARTRKANADVIVEAGPPRASMEQFALFTRYQYQRHRGGGMDRMGFAEFRALMEDSPVDTRAFEFRTPDGGLLGVMLADALGDGMSAVYSFFDPGEARRGFGTYMILWLIGECQRLGLPYMYLGYLIEGCAKMDYKARFRPLEVLTTAGWTALEPARVDGGRSGDPDSGGDDDSLMTRAIDAMNQNNQNKESIS